jgi:hypothetical protein
MEMDDAGRFIKTVAPHQRDCRLSAFLTFGATTIMQYGWRGFFLK